jgi:hypothetical protein
MKQVDIWGLFCFVTGAVKSVMLLNLLSQHGKKKGKETR